MRKHKILYSIITVLAVLMAIVVCRFILIKESPLVDHIKLYESVNGLSVDPYYDDINDIYYVFLPSYSNMDDLKITYSDFMRIHFSDGKTDYDTINSIPLGQDITLTIKNFYQTETYTIQFLQCQSLPTIYVETESGSIDYINEDRDNEETVTVHVFDINGFDISQGICTMAGRGNISWNGEKKPYNLKFDQPISLLNNDETASTWCLLANYSDDSQLRNVLSYYAAWEVEIPYTSKMEYVSLYVDGEYLGLYTVATKQDYLSDTNSSICAVFEQTDAANYSCDYISDQGTCVCFQYGEKDVIVSAVNKLDDLLLQEETVPFDEISQTIDVESFARKFMLEEFLANYDNFKSQYFAVDKKGKIYAICPWDFDLTFGATYNQYMDIPVNAEVMTNTWYIALFQYEEFQTEVDSLLLQYADTLQDALIDYLDASYAAIDNDWSLNKLRWENATPFYSGRMKLKTSSYDLNTLEGNTSYIENFIKERFRFLQDYWEHPEAFCSVIFSDDSMVDVCLYYKKGTAITEETLPDGALAIVEERFLGWYTENDVSIYDIDTVTTDMIFYGSWAPAIEDNEEPSEVITEISVEANLSLRLLKKIYHSIGLDAFGRNRLIVCGIFATIFLGLIITEIRTRPANRKGEK